MCVRVGDRVLLDVRVRERVGERVRDAVLGGVCDRVRDRVWLIVRVAVSEGGGEVERLPLPLDVGDEVTVVLLEGRTVPVPLALLVTVVVAVAVLEDRGADTVAVGVEMVENNEETGAEATWLVEGGGVLVVVPQGE